MNTPTFKYDFVRAARHDARRHQLRLITATAGAPLVVIIVVLWEVIR